MAIYLDREGVEGCISKIKNASDTLRNAAAEIQSAMDQLPEFWQGNSYNKCAATYESDYKTMISKSVPDTVEGLKGFINQCTNAIIEVDESMAK